MLVPSSIQTHPKFCLVNKVCADVGLKHQVSIVGLFTEKQSLDRLDDLANDSKLSKHVQHLFYDVSVLDHQKVMEYPQWKRSAMHLLELKRHQMSATPHPFTERGWESVWQDYRLMCRDQRRLLHERFDESVIYAALPKFTGLQKVTISSGCSYTRPDQNPWEEDPEQHPFVKTVQSPGDYIYPVCKREMTTVLTALSRCDIKISDFRVAVLGWQFFKQDPEQLTMMGKSLSHLRNCEAVVQSRSEG